MSHSPRSLVDEKCEEVDENEQISLELEARPEEVNLVEEENNKQPEINSTEEKSTNSEVSKKSVPQNPYVKLKPNNQQQIPPNQNYRPRFQRWPNHPNHPRWNSAPMQNPNMIPRGGPPMGPMVNPNFSMRPMRPNQFFNSFPNPMQQRPMQPQRFPFKPNEIRPQAMRFPPVPPQIPQANSNNVPGMPRKVLINPNFKGGVEAAKSELTHFTMFSIN